MLLLALLACRPGPDTGPTDTGDAQPPPSQCDAPADEARYVDVGAGLGLFDTNDDDTSRREHGAVAFFDLDGDGDDDLVIAPRAGGVWVQRNDGDRLGLEQLTDLPDVVALGVADIDADYDLDLLVGGMTSNVQLFTNDGAGGFTDVTAAWGLGAGIPGTKRGASFGDLDGDGDPDLYLTVAGGPTEAMNDRLYVNEGGRFVDRTTWLPPVDYPGTGWLTVWNDLDLDGDQDLYVVNADQSTNGPSQLLRNDGPDGDRWRLTDVSDACYCAWTNNPMGASTGDYDGDGDFDLFVTNTGPNNLLRNEGDLSFVDVAASLGATALRDPTWMTYGSAFYDYDNDRHLDVFTAAGPLSPNLDPSAPQADQPDILLRGGPSGFVDVAPELGLDDIAAGRGVAVGLLDDDGFLDLAVVHLAAPSGLWRNTCTDSRALIVDLVGQPPNTFGLGARLEVETGSGALWREITATAGWGGAIQPRAHFGLGDETPRRLTVHWPSGTVQEVSLGADTPLRITVEEPG